MQMRSKRDLCRISGGRDLWCAQLQTSEDKQWGGEKNEKHCEKPRLLLQANKRLKRLLDERG